MEKHARLIGKINAIYPWYKPIEVQKGYWHMSNYPELGIILQYKPHAAGVFILNITYFEFFDNALLCNYFKKTLRHPKAIFYITSNKVYINPIGKYTDEDLVELFTYMLNQTNSVIQKLRDALTV